jgi:uncharacterized membrane protein YdjX (TVP38/TMEM64 family)
VADGPSEPPARGGDDRGWLGLVIVVATVAVATVVVLAIPALRDAAGHALHGEGTDLRRQLRDLDVWGVLVLMALMLIHAVVLFPSELVTATAGYVYGFAGGLAIVVTGWLASAMLTYWIGQHAGRPVLRRLAGGHRLDRMEAAVARGGATVLLCARLIPIVPYSLVGYVAGAARVPVWTFVWTSVVGTLPLSTIVVILGTRLEGFHLGDPVVWLALVPLVIAALVARPLSRRLQL